MQLLLLRPVFLTCFLFLIECTESTSTSSNAGRDSIKRCWTHVSQTSAIFSSVQVSIGQAKVSPHPRSVDPAEENDADDEGEIWYNPIPEDDEPEVSRRPSVRLLVPPRAEPQRRPSRAGDVGHGGRSLEGGGDAGPEAPGESSGDGSQGNAAHSTESPHLHRQMLACKPQEEGGPSTSRSTGNP